MPDCWGSFSPHIGIASLYSTEKKSYVKYCDIGLNEHHKTI